MTRGEQWLCLSPNSRVRARAIQAIGFWVEKKQKEPVKKRYFKKFVVQSLESMTTGC